MGILDKVTDKLKDVDDKVGDKLDSVISGEKKDIKKAADKVDDAVDDAKDVVKDAKDKVDDAVDEGKDKISDAIKALNLDSLDLDGLQNLAKGKEAELDSVAADIGKKVLESSDSGKSFDLSSISDLLGKAKEIKEVIAAITSKIGALKG
ncbi:MAG: hypothetical protein IKQ60_10935 [Candidatus Methanomethylophilaceae archaeon]|nr:hypothetical protein [Candidatus Methanomethylophilaceae archaeon]